MPLIEIDLTDGAAQWDGDELPDDTFWQDNGQIILHMGDVDIRMTYGQADRLFQSYEKWITSVPAEAEFDCSKL